MLRRSRFLLSSSSSTADPRSVYGGHLPRYNSRHHPTGRDYKGGFSYFGDGSSASNSRQIYNESSGVVSTIKNISVVVLCIYMIGGMLEFMSEVNENVPSYANYRQGESRGTILSLGGEQKCSSMGCGCGSGGGCGLPHPLMLYQSRDMFPSSSSSSPTSSTSYQHQGYKITEEQKKEYDRLVMEKLRAKNLAESNNGTYPFGK